MEHILTGNEKPASWEGPVCNAVLPKKGHEFREEYEDSLTAMSRQYKEHTKRTVKCRRHTKIRACTGEESKRHGALFKEKSEM